MVRAKISKFSLRRLVIAAVGIAVVSPLPVNAAPTEIVLGFDGLAEFSLDVGGFGVTFTGAAVLTCGLSLNCGPFPPFSGKSVIFDNFGSGGVIQAVFDTAKTGSIREVSARVTGNTNITMSAYDSSGNVLASIATGGPNYVGAGSGIPANKLLMVVSATTSIQRVVFRDTGNTFTVDNFAFVGSFRKVAIDPGHGRIGGQRSGPH